MTQQMAPRRVQIHRHIRPLTAQRPRARHLAQVTPEVGRVQRIAEGHEGWEETQRLGGETVEIGQVPRLVDAVDVGFLWCEGDGGLDFISDLFEEAGLEEGGDDAVFVASVRELAFLAQLPAGYCFLGARYSRLRVGVFGFGLLESWRRKEVGSEVGLYFGGG